MTTQYDSLPGDHIAATADCAVEPVEWRHDGPNETFVKVMSQQERQQAEITCLTRRLAGLYELLRAVQAHITGPAMRRKIAEELERARP